MNLKFWERLPEGMWATPRARTIWKIVGGVGLVVVPISLEAWSWVSSQHNARLSESLATVQGARADLAQRKQRSQGIAARYAKKAPALGGLLETEAKKADVQLTDSVDRPELPSGKMYVERQTVVHMKKTAIVPILLMLEGVEQSGYPLTVQRLNLRKRGGEPDAYDVELGVSAYDRNAAAAAAPKPDATKAESKDKP